MYLNFNVISKACIFLFVLADGQVVTRISENESAGDTEEIDKENVNVFNITSTERSNDTTLIASMEKNINFCSPRSSSLVEF